MTYLFTSICLVLFEKRSQLTWAVIELVFVALGDLELLMPLPPLM